MRWWTFSIAAAASLAPAHAIGSPFGLPWPPGIQVELTQDCRDSCCSDHVGDNGQAWDFSSGGGFPVIAAREGTVVHLKASSTRGCETPRCVDEANYIVIDHGDGTASVYLHLEGGSVDPAIRCGEFVRRGQRLATAGSTGWSTGPHLHFQVNPVRDDKSSVCECGADGSRCGPDEARWSSFWSDRRHPAMPIAFEEWTAGECRDRRLLMPRSQNFDRGEAVPVADEADASRVSWSGGLFATLASGYRGAARLAPSAPAGAPSASARFSFRGAVDRPGIYEVRSFVPLAVSAPLSSRAPFEIVGRGRVARGTLEQAVVGGAFHVVPGLDAVKLTGAGGEVVIQRNDSGEAGRSVAFDAVLLHRIGDPGAQEAGAACSSPNDCVGSLVCAAGVCAAGCDEVGCPDGLACQPTGLCGPPAPARSRGS